MHEIDRESFGGLFKKEDEISDELLDEQTLGNHDYCFFVFQTGNVPDI